jgi:predicted ArsR family transcriptional regulator
MWWFHHHFITVVPVENNPLRTPRPAAPGYGPRPGTGRSSSQSLSRSRAALLETLRTQTEPTTLAALVATSGLHANTVGEHLHALVRAGLARRHPEAPAGRGRPAWLYEATERDVVADPEYAGLASALAAAIHRTSTSPTDDAVTAGREWGHELARERGATTAPSAVAARREVVTLLDEMGFAPQADARSSVVALTRCPLLEAAHKYPDVVCGVHLGLVQGALEEYGADSAGAELLPFAEPGACRLHLVRRTR